MPALPRDLQLDHGELDKLLESEWNLRIATMAPSGRINLTPLWFVWVDGAVYAFCRGQKIVNLRRNPAVTVLVDQNELYAELRGAMIEGRATVLEDEAAEDADPVLPRAREAMGRKYAGGRGEPVGDPPAPIGYRATGRTMRWVRIDPVGIVSWDNAKLPRR